MLLQSGFQPPDGISNVDLPAITGNLVDNFGVFLLWKLLLDPGVHMHGSECQPRLEDISEVVY